MDEGRRGDRELVTIPRGVWLGAQRYGDRPAIVDGARTLTFASLEAEVRRATRALLTLGIARGDRVAVWAPNGWRWIVAALAAHSAGAALVPVNTRFKGEEAAYILPQSGAPPLLPPPPLLHPHFP